MAFDFKGKVIVITGAASGIGLAVAKRLHTDQAQLALCDVNSAGLKQLAEDLQSPHHKVFHLDVTSSQQCQDTITNIVGDFGKIDCLFNCAGINPTTLPLQSTTDEYWDKIVDTSLKGTYLMTRSSIPHLTRGSVIVNVSSVAGLKASAGHAIYNAAKFGVIGFSQSMALELGPQGIRVNAVAPGSIKTPTNNSVRQGQEVIERTEQGVALRRMGTAEEVANVVVFLFSEQSSYVNGSVIEISGGL
ncbi:hypothetical protein H2204_000091 [Knufia peltigerae]|uniref:Uncharacterized protein n=1 Tax=Knufia peltigerae TaxID=1002370 RepID=A0AA38YF97_9EURO|nr:hypothetical protein H2204_000091 [Knufia peltigerae]